AQRTVRFSPTCSNFTLTSTRYRNNKLRNAGKTQDVEWFDGATARPNGAKLADDAASQCGISGVTAYKAYTTRAPVAHPAHTFRGRATAWQVESIRSAPPRDRWPSAWAKPRRIFWQACHPTSAPRHNLR